MDRNHFITELAHSLYENAIDLYYSMKMDDARTLINEYMPDEIDASDASILKSDESAEMLASEYNLLFAGDILMNISDIDLPDDLISEMDGITEYKLSMRPDLMDRLAVLLND